MTRRNNSAGSRAARRARLLRWSTLAVALVFLYGTVAEARRRRKRRRRKAKTTLVIPAGSATHALKPLEAIGLSKGRVRSITDKLQQQLGRVPGVKPAPLALMRKFLASRDGVTYAACEGELPCVVKFGKLLKAPLVVAGDLSGLGKGYVLFLRLVDPGSEKVLRKVSVVNTEGKAKQDAILREAAYRLLAPEKFVGKLQLEVDVKGAAIFLNGKPLGKSPVAALQVQAGTHALRITHHEYHDFMRFVDVAFEQTTPIKVSLKQFPIISEEMKAKHRKRQVTPHPGGQTVYRPLPWYKRWWFITSLGVALLTATVTTVTLVRQRHLERDGSVTLTQGLRTSAPPLFRFGP